MEPLGIVFTGVGHDYLRATIPVDDHTRQPYGLLHGGVSVPLAETLGSSAGNLCAAEGRLCVGIEINANHLRAIRDGSVTGTARPLHVGGRSTQVWENRIEDDQAAWPASRGSPWRWCAPMSAPPWPRRAGRAGGASVLWRG